MKKRGIIIFPFCVLLLSAKPFDQFPQTQISNGLIHARIYLPDNKEGYYRGSRFDWSGVMPHLEYKGHTYFGKWLEKYDPFLHDAIMGPVEDFFPVGYDEVKPGGNFLKIGIGMMAKPADTKYSFTSYYQLINPGIWKVKKKKDQVEFNHKLSDEKYAYEYKKVIQLIKGKPEMVISHTLKNTGKQTIKTNVYNHNFFVLDNQLTGKDHVIEFPFPLSNAVPVKEDLGKIDGNRIIFLKEFTKNDHLYYGSLQGFGSGAKDYDIKVENHKTGAAVRITSDRPLLKLIFWSAQKTVCPEPYTHIEIKPGDTFSWKIFYQFYICDIIN